MIFLHFVIDPALLRPEVPAPFELELHEGRAIVSLVALTKQNFRNAPNSPLWAAPLKLLREQRLFNLRTYVRHQDAAGAFFFWSWLARPWNLPLPDQPLGLSCAFAHSEYRHDPERGRFAGSVVAGEKQFVYEAQSQPAPALTPCPAGSPGEFALERFTGYFWHRDAGRVFHASHPAWLQTEITAQVTRDDLVRARFPWFRQTRFLGANYSPGFDDVWIGRPRPLSTRTARGAGHRHGPSALFEMP